MRCIVGMYPLDVCQPPDDTHTGALDPLNGRW